MMPASVRVEPAHVMDEEWPCRETQIEQLAAFLSPDLPSLSTLVVYGPHATGKSVITKSYLQSNTLPHAIIKSGECVTGRHLLEATVNAVYSARRKLAASPTDLPEQYNTRCENLGALGVHLERLLSNSSKFCVIFDGIDQQREAPPTLIPALSRLGERIPNLVVILIMRHPPPGLLHQTGVPHIYFPPYSRSQSIHIVSQQPLDIFTEQTADDLEYDEKIHEEEKAWLWPRFCTAVWDALGEHGARDLTAFRSTCMKLWRPFVAPIVKGEFGTRDFSRLLTAQRRIFQDETILVHSLLPRSDEANGIRAAQSHELPYYAKWLILSGYLASFNPARMDELYFMKSTERKRRRRASGDSRGTAKPGSVRKIPRHLLAASAFTTDRLLSIFHAILPDDVRAGIDVYKQIATLTSLRLLVRAGGLGSSDPLEPGGKWRVGPMVTWDFALGIARRLEFDLADYVTE